MPQNVTSSNPYDILGRYFSEIRNHELLTKDEEKQLARRFKKHNDRSAADRLVQANLRLVAKIALDYHRGNIQLSTADLVQQGNVGLLHAVNKYDPEKKTKFSYYASFWIKAFITKYLMDNWSFVKIGTTQAQRKLFYNLNKTKEKMQREGEDATPEAIAERVGVKPAEVEEMEKRLTLQDQSLNEPLRARSTEQMINLLPAGDEPMEKVIAGRQLTYLMKIITDKFKQTLNDREVRILEDRILAQEPATLQELGDAFGVSRERIRQIEKNIIQKLRKFFQTELPDFDYYLPN